jgi:hypothetical protein
MDGLWALGSGLWVITSSKFKRWDSETNAIDFTIFVHATSRGF